MIRLTLELDIFSPAEQQPAVDLDPGRRGDPGGHAHGRPPRAVEAEDLLADEVVDVGPPHLEAGGVLAVADGRHVVDQRVVPDVEDVGVVPRNPHPPVDGGPGDGDVVESAPDEAQRLVALGLGHDHLGINRVPLEEPVSGRR